MSDDIESTNMHGESLVSQDYSRNCNIVVGKIINLSLPEASILAGEHKQ